ncbi:Rer1-domain-containing protein [Tilletiaria anomala UBC 951]|uniref:Rer1-domain-containing protein n=1 Tax=Tilletiaria anomala (strain ATCC 24038 / CBS 436.72 / UBC 951) TaxID=1037660 RepID=A0A066VQQ9_TILAU|nr:Rer1-domain-containing protein [Tilletiaria anomala UBC 951]KDN43791.1 Rer1-domain-containing protein [Tilletiaria anomala UBC 951]
MLETHSRISCFRIQTARSRPGTGKLQRVHGTAYVTGCGASSLETISRPLLPHATDSITESQQELRLRFGSLVLLLSLSLCLHCQQAAPFIAATDCSIPTKLRRSRGSLLLSKMMRPEGNPLAPGAGMVGSGAPRPAADELGGPSPAEQFLAVISLYQRQFQAFLDQTTPFAGRRWAFTGGALFIFMLRIVLAQGWYIVCYALFIYLLNLFLAFLTPKFDPSLEDDLAAQDVEEGEPGLPTSASSGVFKFGSRSNGSGGLMSGIFGGPQPEDEFRPFIRRLPEFKFWLSASQAILISLFCTFSSIFDLPVYWPILVVYFLLLFVLTMRRQIQHMIKYRYVPFDLGRKATYGRK